MDLTVRLLAEPRLWCWEIVDRRLGDTLVQSSWATEWMAYESREEALTAGRRRLAELLPRSADGAPPAQGLPTGRRGAALAHLVRDHRLTVTARLVPAGRSCPARRAYQARIRALFSTPGMYRGAFTIVGGHRSNDVYPLIVTVTER
jgi:hypothetical protein